MTNTLSRYLIKQYFWCLCTLIAIIFSVLFIFDFIELTRIATNKNVEITKVLLMSLQKVPMHMQKILGFIFFIAAIILYNRLSKNSEVTIFKAAGLSTYQFVAPVAIFAFALGVFYITAINPLIATMVNNYMRLEAVHLRGNPSLLSVSKTGLWIKQTSDNKEENIIHALRIGGENKKLHEATFYFIGSNGFYKRIDADIAEFKNNAWYLQNARLTTKRTLNERLPQNYRLSTNLTFAQIQESMTAPESLSFWSLQSYITLAENSGLSIMKHKLHFYSLIVKPLFFLAMVVLGAAFSISPPRAGLANRMMLSAFFSGFVLYIISDLIMAFAIAGDISAELASLSPAIFSIMLSILIILYMEESKS